MRTISIEIEREERKKIKSIQHPKSKTVFRETDESKIIRYPFFFSSLYFSLHFRRSLFRNAPVTIHQFQRCIIYSIPLIARTDAFQCINTQQVYSRCISRKEPQKICTCDVCYNNNLLR